MLSTIALGERACLALAIERQLTVLTADTIWTDLMGIVVDFIQIRYKPLMPCLLAPTPCLTQPHARLLLLAYIACSNVSLIADRELWYERIFASCVLLFCQSLPGL
ncbi:MAG: hypothetical protein PHD43_15830 [Methylococcales bacterium]|nr:hypothetical protein [Methylococcales bacterium]